MSNNDVPQEILDRFKRVATATVNTALQYRGHEKNVMEDVYLMTPGKHLAARARTFRFLPQRPDLKAEVTLGENSPEYKAMALCGPGDVFVVDALGVPYGGIGGDVKFLQLKMQRAEGLVTDGAIRDLNAVAAYGLTLYARRRTPGTGWPHIIGYEGNVDIQCGGVLVRPSDVIVGDDDGVVVVPAAWAKEVVQWAEEHERVEEYIIAKIQEENCVPGRYYQRKIMEEIHKQLTQR